MLSASLDSITYISALNFGGTPLQVLNVARVGFIRLDVSDAVLEEFEGVLRDKFGWREDDIADAQQEIRSFANHVTPRGTPASSTFPGHLSDRFLMEGYACLIP